MGRRESWAEGEGVSCQGSAEPWEGQKRKPSKKVWRGTAHSQHPQLGKYTGGAAGRGSGGEPRDTRYSRGWGGQKVTTHKEERKVKREASERKTGAVGAGANSE